MVLLAKFRSAHLTKWTERWWCSAVGRDGLSLEPQTGTAWVKAQIHIYSVLQVEHSNQSVSVINIYNKTEVKYRKVCMCVSLMGIYSGGFWVKTPQMKNQSISNSLNIYINFFNEIPFQTQ